MRWPLIFACATLIGSVAVLPAAAQPAPAEPASEWPCVQRLVPEIAAAQVWSGPPLDQVEGEPDPALQALAGELAARRVPLPEAQAMVEDFAAGLADDEKPARLSRLFKQTLGNINQDRSSIIAGIRRFTRGQRELAERINQRNAELRALPQDQVMERERLSAERDWDVRVFDDRRASLTYLCEQPVLLEQRAFALGRTIGGELK